MYDEPPGLDRTGAQVFDERAEPAQDAFRAERATEAAWSPDGMVDRRRWSFGEGLWTPPPVLLADASWYGTLGAARDLGSRGLPVIVAYDRPTAMARWSRFATSTVRCPSTHDVERFVAWLHDFGAANRGCVLYPTSDDVAFLIALHHATLAPLFRLFTPPLEALMAVLDKSRLGVAAQRAGLATPRTWSPTSEAEVEQLLHELPMPVLVKPRAQIIARVSSKGVRVDTPEDLVRCWREVRGTVTLHPQALAVAPQLDCPVIQELHEVSESIYTLDGFVDRTGRLVGALACVKTLQMPRRSGPGVWFDPAELDSDLVAGVERLCRETGHVGVFDAEFAQDGDAKLLIDFNPRFYNHMAFEIDRGLPLPWLAYLATMNESEVLHGVAEASRMMGDPSSEAYVHRLPLRLMLAAQRISGGMTRDEVRRWRAAVPRRGRRLTDPVNSHRDLLPALVEVADLFRHPRSLLRCAGR